MHEEIVTAFLKLPTREQSFSLQIHESKSKRTWLGAYRAKLLVLQPLSMQCMDTAAAIHTHKHTISFTVFLVRLRLYYIEK